MLVWPWNNISKSTQKMWLLRPTGGRSDSLGGLPCGGQQTVVLLVGTGGATDARSRPLVSFWGAQGSGAEEHCHTSICHHCSFDCKCVRNLLPAPLLLWSVVSSRYHSGPGSEGSNRLPGSHGQDIADSTQESQWPWRPRAEQKPSEPMPRLPPIGWSDGGFTYSMNDNHNKANTH